MFASAVEPKHSAANSSRFWWRWLILGGGFVNSALAASVTGEGAASAQGKVPPLARHTCLAMN